MEVQEYIDQLKDLHTILIEYIENENDIVDDFQILINFLETQKILENKDESKEFFHLLLIISRNHHRYPIFFQKIDKILDFFQEEIKQVFSKSELFKIFKKNKRILLYFFKKSILATNDKSISDLLLKKIESKNSNFRHFFYPEIKSIVDEEKSKLIEKELLNIDSDIFTDFEEKRLTGENDSFICQLIRNDSVEQFISHVTQKRIKLSSQIRSSIFETNSFLVKKRPTLIEYSAFYGSIQIFQYLKLNGVILTSSLWLYAIHGKNPEMIHLLEENHIQPDDKTYEKCLKEAIKFHHNEIASYIQNNLIDDKVIQYNLEKKFNENILSYCFHYYNYSYLPNELKNKFTFFYLCQFNYYSIVELLIGDKDFDINKSLIKKKSFF